MTSENEGESTSARMESNSHDGEMPESSVRRSLRVATGVARPAHISMFGLVPNAPTSYFKKKRGADPIPLIWTKKEKKDFYEALVEYGHDDITLLQKSVPTRSKAEIKEKMNYYKNMGIQYQCVHPKGSNPQRTCLKWMNVLDQACKVNNDNIKLSTAVSAVMECDKSHPHSNVYKFIENLLEDKLNPDDLTNLTPAEAELILRTMNKIQIISKSCHETIIKDPIFNVLPNDNIPIDGKGQENTTPEKTNQESTTQQGAEGETTEGNNETSTTQRTENSLQDDDQSAKETSSNKLVGGSDENTTKSKRIQLEDQLKNTQYTSVNPLCLTENTLKEISEIVHNKLGNLASLGQ